MIEKGHEAGSAHSCVCVRALVIPIHFLGFVDFVCRSATHSSFPFHLFLHVRLFSKGMGFPLYDAPGGGGAAAAAASGGGGAVAQLRAHQSMVAQGRRTVPRFSYIGDSDSEEDDMYVHSTSTRVLPSVCPARLVFCPPPSVCIHGFGTLFNPRIVL